MLTTAQKEAGRLVHQRLREVEVGMRRLHRALAALRDEFQDDLSVDEFIAFGGGTDKPDED